MMDGPVGVVMIVAASAAAAAATAAFSLSFRLIISSELKML